LRRFPYCGHGVLLGHLKYPWQDGHHILERFGLQEAAAKRRYTAFVSKGIPMGKRTDLTGGGLLRSQGGWAALKAKRQTGARQKGDERILGDNLFVTRVLAEAEERLNTPSKLRAQGYDLDRLIHVVADCVQITAAMLFDRQRDRRRTRARDMLCFLATDRLGTTQTELAERLQLTQSAISQAVVRGRALVANDAYPVLNRLF
jgi:putative transposase